MKILTDVELRSAKAGGERAIQLEMRIASVALNFAIQKPDLDDISVCLSNLLALHDLALTIRREGEAFVAVPEKTEAEKFAEAVGCCNQAAAYPPPPSPS